MTNSAMPWLALVSSVHDSDACTDPFALIDESDDFFASARVVRFRS